MLVRGSRSPRRARSATAFRPSPREQAEQILRDHRDLVLALVHEVRTPLAVIRGQVDVLQDDGAVAGSHEALAAVREAVGQVIALTDDLLAMAREDPDGPPLVSGLVIPALREVAPGLVERGAARNVLVHCDVEAGLPPAYGVGPALQAVLHDLGAYLVDRVPAGSIVTIAAAARDGGVELSVSTDAWRDTPGRPDRGGPSPLLAAVTRRRVESLGGAFAWQAVPPRYTVTLPSAPARLAAPRKVASAAAPR
ncbi:MAG TPA: histidine kinase dimerization/phospho-acceptor domain-containing protein [Mycobacteriales bacterium]|nr:histidine kinase dimerization/phospho-acceptor domain-containing protein [Mycobacteriales bacterium]